MEGKPSNHKPDSIVDLKKIAEGAACRLTKDEVKSVIYLHLKWKHFIAEMGAHFQVQI